MNYQESMNSRWRRELFRICIVFAILEFIIENILFLFYPNIHPFYLSERQYKLRFIVLPSVINMIAISAVAVGLKDNKISNEEKNTSVCVLFYFFCASTQVIHYVHAPLLVLPTIAILVTILFANKKLTRYIFLASLGSLFFSYLLAALEMRRGDVDLHIDVLLSAGILYMAYVIANLLTNYVRQQIDYIVDSSERQKLLMKECHMDALMGIGNRRALDSRLEEVTKEASESENMYLLLIDIDNFKQINDIYGHQCGDEVLIVLAGLIRAMTPYERIEGYRYGGEEIVVLLRNKDEQQAVQCCENIRHTFENLRYSFEPNRKITFSGGLVAYQKEMTVEQWVSAADEALYFAKGNGKNQIQREVAVRMQKG